LQGKVQVTRIRSVQIEDLLGREPVYLDEEQLGQFLAGKRVMVTGAGGSIGSELARQVARFHPSRLLLVERAEFALFEIDGDLRRTRPEIDVVPLVADVCDEARMRMLLSEHKPQILLHAAAHKHVPLMESNPGEAIKNNILATRMLGELAGEHQVEAFVLISTDKAVRPTSIMGASKRVAELAIQDLGKRYPTRYVAVRFGNVIGSAGSVVPIFREQIRRGGPVTVTHPEMRRYFMTIPEASQLVLQAGAMGEGGEILILDMGKPVRILDLAEEMITLTGLRPYVDMAIDFTGLRPGEKLFEELELSGEQIAKTRHPKIYIGKLNAYPSEEVERALRYLEELARDGDGTAVRKFLNSILPEASLGVRRISREAPRTTEAVPEQRATPPYA
jgi:FlaA1/EpsC-like NDP-sugar epimerase